MTQNHVPGPGPTRLVKGNGWIALGVGLLVVAVLFALAAISVHLDGIETDCGTRLSPSAPDDLVIGPACEEAQQQRTWLVASPAVLGVLSLAAGIVIRVRARRG